MKIHAFRVDTNDGGVPLESILEQISQEPSYQKRNRLISHVEQRADAIEKRDSLWLIDFVRIRTSHGPGKVGRDTQVEGFEFKDNEGFGEETAALYDPVSNFILIQYNHHGVRAGNIADYLTDYDATRRNVYTFKPKFDDDVERRLHNQEIIRKVNISIDMTKMSEQDKLRGRALSDALDYGRSNNAEKMKIEISVQRENKGGLSLTNVKETLRNILDIRGQNPEAIPKIEVSGKESLDSVIEVLDLTGHRLFVEFNDLKLGVDLRFPRCERWGALLRAKNEWKQLLL